MNYPSMTSHEEGFLMALQEQEITTRAIRKAREKTHRRKLLSLQYVDFAIKRKRTYFIVCSCTELSSSMYLPIMHNPITKSIYREILEVIEPGRKRQNGEPPPVIQRVETMRFGGTKLYQQAASSNTIDQISYSGTMKHKSSLLLKSPCHSIQMSQQEQATRKKQTWNLLKRSQYYTQGTNTK